MITMRLFAEEKRTGTIELLATSPVSDCGSYFGQVAFRRHSVRVHAPAYGREFLFLFKYAIRTGKPLLIGYLGLLLQAGALLAIGTFISTLTKKSNHRRRCNLCGVLAPVDS